jgi:RNA polymerase sigma-70 factor (ECF subfamily)
MAQEVFVQVFKAIHQFRGDATRHLDLVTVNLCKNRASTCRGGIRARRRVDGAADRAPLAEAKGVTSGELSGPDQVVQGYQVEDRPSLHSGARN